MQLFVCIEKSGLVDARCGITTFIMPPVMHSVALLLHKIDFPGTRPLHIADGGCKVEIISGGG